MLDAVKVYSGANQAMLFSPFVLGGASTPASGPMRRRSPVLRSAYVRLEYRRAMEIAVVGAAAAVTLAADGTVASAAVRPQHVRRSGPDDSLGRWRFDEATMAFLGTAHTLANFGRHAS